MVASSQALATYEPQASIWDRLESELAIGLYVEKYKLERRRLTGLLREAEDFEMNIRLQELADWREKNGRGFLAEEKRNTMSAIDRIKAKALQARGIAPQAIKDFESDLDGLIAEGPKLAAARVDAVGKHTAAFKGIREQFDGLHSAIDILSNGEPGEDPLHKSGES